MKWRRANNVVHRDVGYLIVALTLVYAVSGLALNHVADWNPNYRQTKTARQIAPIAPADRDAQVAEARAKLALAAEPRNAFRPDPETLQLFYEGVTYHIDTPTGQVIVEEVRPRPVLFELNQMHLNAAKGAWTIVADVYAAALILMCLTGLLMLRGRTGFSGRGKWLVGLGALVPVAFWIWQK